MELLGPALEDAQNTTAELAALTKQAQELAAAIADIASKSEAVQRLTETAKELHRDARTYQIFAVSASRGAVQRWQTHIAARMRAHGIDPDTIREIMKE